MSMATTSASMHESQAANRPLRWLLGAAGISSLGDGLAVVALPLLATRLTRDPRLIAGLLVAERLPWLGLSLAAGSLADRLPRLALMRMADIVRATVLLAAGLGALGGRLSLPILYLLALSLGAAETVFSTASQATLADLVPLDGLDRANGLLFSGQAGGEQLIGPALGGVVFAISASAPLLVDGFSFFASAVMLAQAARRVRAPEPVAAVGASPPAAAGIKAGLRAFAAVGVLRVLMVLLSGLGLCQAMALALLVVYATRTLHLGPAEYGLFIAAGSVGNVGAGLLVSKIRARCGTATIMTACAVAAASAYLVLAATSSTLVAVGAFIVESFAVVCGCVTSLTVRQSAVPSELRGRIASIFRMAIFGAVPVGAIAGGLLAQLGGVRLPFLVAGGLQLTLAAATARPLRRHLPVPSRAGATPYAARVAPA
jgi:MFS family permease